MNLNVTNQNAWAVWVAAGAVIGLFGVLMGSFAAHEFEGRLDADAMSTLETGIRFQMYHAIALVMFGGLSGVWNNRALAIACGLLTFGVIVFCGSLYLIALADIGVFGAVAPVGGLSLMAGWGALAVGALRHFVSGKA